MDMSAFVIPKSDQLNADDLTTPITVRVVKVSGTGNADQPVAIHFEGDNGRPYKPCKSMRRVMIAAWGVDAAEYVGRSMTLYRDPDVMFGGMKVGGVRISHMSNLAQPLNLALTVTKAKRAPYRVSPLKTESGAPARPAASATPDTERNDDPKPTSGGVGAHNAWLSAPLEPTAKERIPLVHPEAGETRYFASVGAWMSTLTTLADVNNCSQLWDANVGSFEKLLGAAKTDAAKAALEGVRARFDGLEKKREHLDRQIDNLGV